MLNHEEDSYLPTAAEARVFAHELTEALALIEIRKARLAYEQAGTFTLGEAAAECRIDATPEELQVEIDCIRTADAVQQKAKRWQQRLRLGLIAEIISAALCLLALLGLVHTEFNPDWRQARQVEDFQQKLRLSAGPNPKYDIFVVPYSSERTVGSQSMLTTFGIWKDHAAYPLYCIPEGYNIYRFEDLDDEGRNGMMPFYQPGMTTYVEFREPQAAWFRDNISVYYNGLRYWRGMIRRQDIPSLHDGHGFTLYPALVASPQYKIDDTVPLTVSLQSIKDAGGQWGQEFPQCYDLYQFPEGAHVHLDEHAWEQYLGPQ